MYTSEPDFRQRASAFLTEGLLTGNRLVYLSRGDANDIRAALQPIAEPQCLVDRGSLVLGRTEDVYGCQDLIDPRAILATYVRATREAVAHGYTGMRIVADGTDLVRTPAQRRAFAKYEFLIDRYAADEPLYSMCGYDVGVLGRDAVAQLACLHPRANPDATPFRWHAVSHADVALVGEVDHTSVGLFEVTLERTLPVLGRSRVDVDAARLTFIDHRGLLALDRHARRTDTEVTLRNTPSVTQQLVDLLDLRAVRAQ